MEGKWIKEIEIMKTLKILIIGVFLSIEGSFAQSLLQQYQDSAALNNPGIQALFKQYEVAMQRVPQMSSLPDPSFTIHVHAPFAFIIRDCHSCTWSTSQTMPQLAQWLLLGIST